MYIDRLSLSTLKYHALTQEEHDHRLRYIAYFKNKNITKAEESTLVKSKSLEALYETDADEIGVLQIRAIPKYDHTSFFLTMQKGTLFGLLSSREQGHLIMISLSLDLITPLDTTGLFEEIEYTYYKKIHRSETFIKKEAEIRQIKIK